MRYGIVLVCYKNVLGFSRLLDSLSRVDYEDDKDVTLIVSIDYSGDDSVYKVAQKYEWNHGEYIINAHKKNMGLRAHILSCGDYMEKYNLDAIAVLEDDIYVSPAMYGYMKNAVPFYFNDDRIAGISLYKHEVNINGRRPFYDINDGGDTYFMQYAQSWGQIWIRHRWKEFRNWYDENKWEQIPGYKIPANLHSWKNSWLKFHIMYCIDQNKFFVYPRTSLTTNFSDAGTHVKTTNTKMQVPFLISSRNNWNFNSIDNTNAVYDAFFEPLKLSGKYLPENTVIDSYGVKQYPDDSKYVLTSKLLPYEVKKSWKIQFRPWELNVILDNEGNDLFLYDCSVIKKKPKTMKVERNLFEYDLKGVNIITKQSILYGIRVISNHLKIRIKKLMRILKK